jgi:glycosyltransferase involved in cell wall biosynthesis
MSIAKCRVTLKSGLAAYVRRERPDVVFWPIVWRESRWRTKVACDLGLPIVGYFPGGVYRFTDVLYAVRRIGVRPSLPYLWDALANKRQQLSFFQKAGIHQLIAMTEWTAHTAIRAGWPQEDVAVIPPGREDAHELSAGHDFLRREFRAWVAGRPFFLFMGPPSEIRGVHELLSAFDVAAQQNDDLCLVCLFRNDADLDTDRMRAVIDRIRCRDRVYVVWESASREELAAFMQACHAVVLPFVIVPSEVPLAIVEALAYGKPVITTLTGGTGRFVDKFGITCRLGDIRDLAAAMLLLVSDTKLYDNRCEAVVAMHRVHPQWDRVCRAWIDVASPLLDVGSSA